MNVIENLKPNQHTKQGFCPPPPLKARTRNLPEDCNLSFIDQIQDGDYSGSKLVRSTPRTNKDIYFKSRPRKARPTEMKSIRRYYSHKSVAHYRTKKDGATRANIEYLSCSFLELDGSTDSTLKNKEDVLALINKNGLPRASYVIETSPGHFHLLWNYTRALPWTPKNESYWLAQQKRLIELFKRGGFLVDEGASMNPVQNLRNPSQLNPYNFKRRCEVFIYKSYCKTSLRRLYKALNATNIKNPKRVPARDKYRRFLRANQTYTLTDKEQAITLGFSLRTIKREKARAIRNGDLEIVQMTGNNKGTKRTTEYISNLYIEANSQECHISICKANSVKETDLLTDFRASGAAEGWRNRTIFALGLYLKCLLGKGACIEAIRAELLQGSGLCHVSEREFERTLQNVMKNSYTHPCSLPKLRAWGLLGNRKITEILH